jgi:YesN/AraC family two-component response regulator
MPKVLNSGLRSEMKNLADPVPVSILLVEDEEAILKLLVIILARKFPDVVLHTAVNGRTGLELFQSHLPDIVISDVNMPEMGGVQMADEIRAIKPDTKFIIVTGDSGIAFDRDADEKRSGFDHYIMKPVVVGALVAAIEQCRAEIAQQHSP